MAAGQREPRFFVFRERKCRRLVPAQIMATFAFVEVRSSRKLPRMFINVAIEAPRKLDLVDRRLARRDMALLTLHFRVLAFQCVLRGGMILDRERRRLPSPHRVARRALSRARTLRKLPAMRVWRMAIGTLGER